MFFDVIAGKLPLFFFLKNKICRQAATKKSHRTGKANPSVIGQVQKQAEQEY
jgi:hypothetical protein